MARMLFDPSPLPKALQFPPDRFARDARYVGDPKRAHRHPGDIGLWSAWIIAIDIQSPLTEDGDDENRVEIAAEGSSAIDKVLGQELDIVILGGEVR